MSESIPSPPLEQEVLHLAEQCSILLRENEWLRAKVGQLKAKRDGLQKLLDDKSYVQCLADYNRGHLSHHSYLNATRRRALEGK
jgi:hypothetical protein